MKTILIIVDMQSGFLNRDELKDVSQRIVGLLEKKIFDCVIATRFRNDSHSIFEKALNWSEMKSKEEQEIVPEIEQYVDFVFEKNIYNCVNSTFLQKLCQVNGGEYPQKVYIAGADTDCSVMITAVSLFESNIKPIVLTKYCASNGGENSHNVGLLCMKRLIGEKQLLEADVNMRCDLEQISTPQKSSIWINPPSDFARNLYLMRQKMGWSQRDLASHLSNYETGEIGINPATISAYENSGRIPRQERKEELANLFGVKIEDFFAKE